MSLFSELQRRNVFRVGIAYVIGSWLVIQVADTPGIHRANYFTAVEIAYLYIRSGKEEKGRQLLEVAIPVIDAAPILGLGGTYWGKARTYALLGREDEALAEIQQRRLHLTWQRSSNACVSSRPAVKS